MKKHIGTIALYGLPLVLVAGLVILIVSSPKEGNRLEVTPDILASCIQHANIALHIHPHIAITVNGNNEPIPVDVGIESGCMHPIHTHDSTGTLHIEYLTPKEFTLGQFFETWDKSFTSQELMGNIVDGTHRIRMMVDGVESTEYGNLILRDDQKIELFYEEIPAE